MSGRSLDERARTRYTPAMIDRPRKNLLGNAIAGVGAIVIALILAEGILRIIGFSFHLYPERIEFGWPDPVTLKHEFLPDPDLLWVPTGYSEKLTRLQNSPPSLIYMGDSCTQYGRYDTYLRDIFQQHYPDRDFSFGNVGVGGWSSYQGLRQLERDIAGIKPRVITFYYGWNDHWIGFGIEDENVAKMSASSSGFLGRLRVMQLINKAAVTFMQDEAPDAAPRRVSPQSFRENLTRMVRIARTNDIVPVLITAPTSHTAGKEPAQLRERFLPQLDQLVPLHSEYVQIVRDVARDENVILADLAWEFDQLPRDYVTSVYFNFDGIHLRDAGNRKIAEFLYKRFEENHLLDRLQ